MAHPIHINWYQSRSILGDWSHNGGRELPYLAPGGVLESKNSNCGVLESKNSNCHDRSIHGVQQCHHTATEKISHHMEELVAQMDKTIRRYSLDLKEIFSECNNNLAQITNKILEDKKKSDDLWKPLIIKKNTKYSKADISVNVDSDYEEEAVTGFQEHVHANVESDVKAVEEISVVSEIFKQKAQRRQNFSQQTSMSVKGSEILRHPCKGDAAQTGCLCSDHKIEKNGVFRAKITKHKKKRTKDTNKRRVKLRGKAILTMVRRLGLRRRQNRGSRHIIDFITSSSRGPQCTSAFFTDFENGGSGGGPGLSWRLICLGGGETGVITVNQRHGDAQFVVRNFPEVGCGSGGGPGLLWGGGVGTVWVGLGDSNYHGEEIVEHRREKIFFHGSNGMEWVEL